MSQKHQCVTLMAQKHMQDQVQSQTKAQTLVPKICANIFVDLGLLY